MARSGIAAAFLPLFLACALRGQASPGDGTPVAQWLPGLGSPDMGWTVNALAPGDLGDGPALFAGGRFQTAGGVPAERVARLTGDNWAPLGSGMNGEVHAVAVLDLGGGPALYAGGSFNLAGGVPAANIARWEGSAWAPLGAGCAGGAVHALAVFDDGGGPALYAAGNFTTAGGLPATRIAKWNGAAWSALGSGVNDLVRCLLVHDDGSGPALYAGGEFDVAGGVTAWGLARWNGAAWSAVWSGAGAPGVGSGVAGWVYAMAEWNPGGGTPRLYVTGSFLGAGLSAANGVARWNGVNWAGVGSGITGLGYALLVHDDGGGEALYVGGDFHLAGGASANRIARWDGTAWTPLGTGFNTLSRALAEYDAGDGPRLHAGGEFTTAGGLSTAYFSRWDGNAWRPVGQGLDGHAIALEVFDGGSGPELYAGGTFTKGAGAALKGIGRWDGAGWAPLASGLSGSAAAAFALTVFDDGGGPDLYVGGDFTSAGGVAASRIARWDGAAFTPLGAGLNDQVRALRVFDDGGGPALYAGGWFTASGATSTLRLAKWDGAAWTAVGGGTNNWVYALEVHDDGGGPGLYVGGGFTLAGGAPFDRLARWRGGAWSAVGGGVSSWVYVLRSRDEVGGPALYAGGQFTSAGGVPAAKIARFAGGAWSALGSGMNNDVKDVEWFDDGSGAGPRLHAAGWFTSAGGVPATYMARWDGAAWSAVDGGLNNVAEALQLFDEGTGAGPALFVSGNFKTAGGLGAGGLARRGVLPPPTAWEDLGFALPGTGGAPLLAGSGTLEAGSANAVELSAAAPLAPAALFVALASTPAPFQGGTLVPFPALLLVFASSDGAGAIPLPFVMPPGVPPGTGLWLQWAIQDAGAAQDVALSNALRGLVP